uniref:CSON004779 protein n=1 Tax=Culicoides sonorensis TaxID=179676 RepID=A0A336LUL9_CULSO
MQLFKVTFILIALSIIEIFGDELQEIVAVPPYNYTKPPYSVKIVGGSPARVHQFPWQASITSCDGGSCYICGGSLISKRYVLTAAHCAAGLTRFIIGLGSNSRNRPAITLTSNIKVVHPQYDAKSLGNDVAVIKLPWSVKSNKAIQPIILPRSNNTYDNANATVSGYGKTSAWSSSSDQLNFVDMPTSIPVELSIAVYTVPEAPCPIFSIFVYFLVGSPTLTIVLSFSRISSSDIFFFLTPPPGRVVSFAVGMLGDVTVTGDFVLSGRLAIGGGTVSSSFVELCADGVKLCACE